MQLTLLLIGKTKDKNLQKLTEEYTKRLKHYCKFKIEILPELKNRKGLTRNEQKIAEGENILKKLTSADFVVLLDEKGKEFTSVSFSKWLQKRLISGQKRIIFIIGGPFGFSEKVYQRADQKLSLSKMTFPHEMIRVFFTEQLYRGFTILKHENYHHE